MRNSEVYAYIERLFDAVNSGTTGITDSKSLTEVIKIVMDLEEEVRKEMESEAKQNSGINSTSFFNDLADSTYDEIIEVGKRMDEVHPSLGKFMQYLMEEDDPTFFVVFGDKKTKLVGNCDDSFIYNTSKHLCNLMLRGDSDDK